MDEVVTGINLITDHSTTGMSEKCALSLPLPLPLPILSCSSIGLKKSGLWGYPIYIPSLFLDQSFPGDFKIYLTVLTERLCQTACVLSEYSTDTHQCSKSRHRDLQSSVMCNAVSPAQTHLIHTVTKEKTKLWVYVLLHTHCQTMAIPCITNKENWGRGGCGLHTEA
jgi:hypothetical protein